MTNKRCNTSSLKGSSKKRVKLFPLDTEHSKPKIRVKSMDDLMARVLSSPTPPPPEVLSLSGTVDDNMVQQEWSSTNTHNSSQSLTFHHNENDAVTPEEWANSCNPVKEDEELEQEMVNLSITLEEEQYKNKLLREIENEKYRLVDEIIYPITKSCTKFLSIGVKPLENFIPVVRMNNPQLTAAITFNLTEFEEFLSKVEELIPLVKAKNPLEEICVMKLKKYEIYECRHMVLKFKPKDLNDVYEPLYLSVDTVRSVIDMGDHIRNLLQVRRLKNRFYPDYDGFIRDVALYIMEKGNENIKSVVTNVIKEKYDNNASLWEMFLKLPSCIKTDVDCKLNYFSEHNSLVDLCV